MGMLWPYQSSIETIAVLAAISSWSWMMQMSALSRSLTGWVSDKYGGAVLLTPADKMAGLHDGDLVCVHGRIVGEGRAALPHAGAVYQVNMLSPIEPATAEVAAEGEQGAEA